MVNKMIRKNSESELPHICGARCLGPLTFHREAMGALVSLSQGARRAERTGRSFRHGLVFSSRPVRVRERVRLRVERCVLGWHGGLRVGFTTVPPMAGAVPSLAIPDLTETPGYWAAPVPETHCLAGSELEFWVSCGGNVYFKRADGRQHQLLQGVDLSQPLWAMIDIYGQTCSVLLLGSEKKEVLGSRKSCPVPQRNPCTNADNCFNLNQISDVCHHDRHCDSLHDSSDPCHVTEKTTDSESVEDCAVCLTQKACITLLCGHRCLCFQCSARVIQEFGICPLCRQDI